MSALFVALGASLGACARYLTDRAVPRREGGIPWATLLVNVIGSLVLGWVAAASSSEQALLLVGVGFCGALTTVSSFAWETVALARGGAAARAAAYVALSLALGVAAAWLGVRLGGH